jgi:hypothetical protein
MVQTLQAFKAACDAAGIVPEFPPEVEAVRARLYSSSGGESAPEGVGAGGGGEGVRLRTPAHPYLHVLAAGHPGRTSATLAILLLPTVPMRALPPDSQREMCARPLPPQPHYRPRGMPAAMGAGGRWQGLRVGGPDTCAAGGGRAARLGGGELGRGGGARQLWAVGASEPGSCAGCDSARLGSVRRA